MNQTRSSLSTIWNRFQGTLFSWLTEKLGVMTIKQQLLIEMLDVAQIERHLPYIGNMVGRPQENHLAISNLSRYLPPLSPK